jgi:hypothetical protein
MNKLVFNFYLAITLGLAVQAIFVIFFGNTNTINRLKYEQIQEDNQAIVERLNYLQEEIAKNSTITSSEQTITELGYIPIDYDKMIVVSPQNHSDTDAIASKK